MVEFRCDNFESENKQLADSNLDNEIVVDELLLYDSDEEENEVPNELIVKALDKYIELIEEVGEGNLTDEQQDHILKLLLKLVWQLWEKVMMTKGAPDVYR